MIELNRVRRASRARRLGLWALLGLSAALAGCEMDSWFDPSVLGRWERTPVVLPILDHLDVIDEPSAKIEGLTQVMPEDLIAEVAEYTIGPGDTVSFSISDLVVAGQDYGQYRRVDELGLVRLPIIGTLKVEGKTASQLEREIALILQRKQQIKEPVVSVSVAEGRQRSYSVIGDPQLGGTNFGSFVIPRPDFRLLEALSQARGVSGQVKKVYVIRQIQLVKPTEINTAEPQETGRESAPPPANPADLIKELMGGLESEGKPTAAPPAKKEGLEAPVPLQSGLEPAQNRPQWVNVYGKWVKVEPAAASAQPATQPSTTAVQRVIEIPYAKLAEGDMQYNIVVRSGDVIRIPPSQVGNVYVGGQIGRPGTFNLPGDKDLNLKQLVFSAGGLTSTAMPHRVDLIRRIGDNQEATVRLDLRAIFNGTQPDFFLKPNDTINFGTSWIATPLAVARSGFRASYGFGFTFDRNFDNLAGTSSSSTGR